MMHGQKNIKLKLLRCVWY